MTGPEDHFPPEGAAVVWGIRRKGVIFAPTIRTTRSQCIADYVRLDGNKSVDRVISKRWSKMKRWGWECVKLALVPYGPAERRT